MIINIHAVDSFINQADRAITSARRDPEIAAALSEFGYTPDKLQNGATFLAGAKMYYAETIITNGLQSLQLKGLLHAWDTADQFYSVHRRLAQIALKYAPKQIELLGLVGPKRRSLSGWLLQARQFYTNALLSADAEIALARFNLTRQKLLEGQALVRQVAEMENAIIKDQEELQDMLKIDSALDNLVYWFDDFMDVARVALESKPYLLEKLKAKQPA